MLNSSIELSGTSKEGRWKTFGVRDADIWGARLTIQVQRCNQIFIFLFLNKTKVYYFCIKRVCQTFLNAKTRTLITNCMLKFNPGIRKPNIKCSCKRTWLKDCYLQLNNSDPVTIHLRLKALRWIVMWKTVACKSTGVLLWVLADKGGEEEKKKCAWVSKRPLWLQRGTTLHKLSQNGSTVGVWWKVCCSDHCFPNPLPPTTTIRADCHISRNMQETSTLVL